MCSEGYSAWSVCLYVCVCLSECQKIKHIREQWISGPFLRFFEWAWVRTWIIYYMGWKLGILHIEISDAILVKRCHNDLRNKIMEPVLKNAQKPVETLHKLRMIIIN